MCQQQFIFIKIRQSGRVPVDRGGVISQRDETFAHGGCPRPYANFQKLRRGGPHFGDSADDLIDKADELNNKIDQEQAAGNQE